jgi:hypothetical protein
MSDPLDPRSVRNRTTVQSRALTPWHTGHRAIVVWLLLLLSSATAAAQGKSPASISRAGDSVESIYVVRSWRESRIAPTDFCSAARAGFPGATVEDRYTFRSVGTGADGTIRDANVRVVGQLHACFAMPTDSGPIAFYADGSLGEVTFTGRGECRTARTDFPEDGLLMQRCFLLLEGLSHGLIGGHLTTNTINSRQPLGGVTDPAGYTQSSIATVRLWRRR